MIVHFAARYGQGMKVLKSLDMPPEQAGQIKKNDLFTINTKDDHFRGYVQDRHQVIEEPEKGKIVTSMVVHIAPASSSRRVPDLTQSGIISDYSEF